MRQRAGNRIDYVHAEPYLSVGTTPTTMLWSLLTSIAACALFVGVYFSTGDVWKATNASGLLVLAALIYLLGKTTRNAEPRGRYAGAVTVMALIFAAISVHWFIWWSMTTWQSGSLRDLRKSIAHGVLSARMEDRAVKTLAGYYREPTAGKGSLQAYFASQYAMEKPSDRLLDSLGDGLSVYLASAADSEVVMIGEDAFTWGESREFKNFDGRTGILQDRVRLTRTGVTYEFQN